jgi:hypothetical protein
MPDTHRSVIVGALEAAAGLGTGDLKELLGRRGRSDSVAADPGPGEQEDPRVVGRDIVQVDRLRATAPRASDPGPLWRAVGVVICVMFSIVRASARRIAQTELEMQLDWERDFFGRWLAGRYERRRVHPAPTADIRRHISG